MLTLMLTTVTAVKDQETKPLVMPLSTHVSENSYEASVQIDKGTNIIAHLGVAFAILLQRSNSTFLAVEDYCNLAPHPSLSMHI